MRRLSLSLLTLTTMLSHAGAARAAMEDYPSVRLQGLDKSVGRTITFEARVGSTIEYGPLYIKINACRKAPPIEKPESAAFLQVWEIPPGQDKSQWVFSGWMFASSPALSAMDHPVYDAWVLDCTGREEPNEEAAAAETDEQAADQTTLAPADGASADGADLPTDSEAEPADEAEAATDSEAAVDSEADEGPAVPVTGALPLETPPLAPSGIDGAPLSQAPVEAPIEAPMESPPVDPTQGQGFTAYDLMRQRQGAPGDAASAPAPAPAPEFSPIY